MLPIQTLEQAGLSKKEATVYTALLELGMTSVLRIAQKTSIKRPTVYITLETLLEKGLVERIPKGGKSMYQALDPGVVLKQFRERIDTFDQALPELRALMMAAPHRPRVRCFEGKKAILNLYTHEIFGGTEVTSFGNIKELRTVISGGELYDLVHIMKANGSKIRELIDDSSESREYLAEKNRLGLGETKFFPHDFSLEIDLLIYGDTVAMVSPKNLMAVVIEDRAISASQKQFFEFVWKSRSPIYSGRIQQLA